MTRYSHADLHHPDGSHRATPPTTHGHDLDVFHRVMTRHLARHRSLDAGHDVRHLPATLPDGTTVPDGLYLDDDGTLLATDALATAFDDWASTQPFFPTLSEHLSKVRGVYEPYDYLDPAYAHHILS